MLQAGTARITFPGFESVNFAFVGGASDAWSCIRRRNRPFMSLSWNLTMDPVLTRYLLQYSESLRGLSRLIAFFRSLCMVCLRSVQIQRHRPHSARAAEVHARDRGRRMADFTLGKDAVADTFRTTGAETKMSERASTSLPRTCSGDLRNCTD